MAPLSKQKLTGLVVAVLLVGVGTGTVVWMNREDTPSDASTVETQPSTSDSSTTPVSSDATYKDGTYSANGAYRSPGGNESIGVTLTIADNIIKDVSITTHGSGSDAQLHQSQFKNGISAVVVGKKVNEVQVSRVSGSSLTSTGFNNALETIKSEAKI